MQYYDITISANGIQEQGVSGRYFYYLSGTTPLITGGITPSAAGNEKIFVQAIGTGEAVPLMPGQSFRIDDGDKRPSGWRITNAMRNEVITGQILIGDGEFRDSNIKNTVKLDLTSANQVTVQNASLATTVTNEVEVKNDAGNPLNVSLTGAPSVTISGTANVQENLFPINAGVAADNQIPFLTTIVTPAENTNGVIVQSAKLFGCSSANQYSLISKATAPANAFDGYVLAYVPAATTTAQFIELTNKLKIPAGMGLYIWSQNNTPTALRLVNASIL